MERTQQTFPIPLLLVNRDSHRYNNWQKTISVAKDNITITPFTTKSNQLFFSLLMCLRIQKFGRNFSKKTIKNPSNSSPCPARRVDSKYPAARVWATWFALEYKGCTIRPWSCGLSSAYVTGSAEKRLKSCEVTVGWGPISNYFGLPIMLGAPKI